MHDQFSYYLPLYRGVVWGAIKLDKETEGGEVGRGGFSREEGRPGRTRRGQVLSDDIVKANLEGV